MEMNESEAARRLIRLKRYESPRDEYFRNFVDEFKERQRSEMLRQSARGLLLERLSMWFEESVGAKRFATVGGLAVASVGAILWLAATRPETSLPDSLTRPALKVERSEGTNELARLVAEEAAPIELQLPARSGRVPGNAEDRLTIAPGVLPAGARGSLREL
ncbi:MAG: hypothetical protein B9S36_07480 [Verrucomicrobiia bacterium Tous-C2TDCM]|nr:MAG: hypothetical protein B9S36_07480 [Verrucomicrobiae bacterium Tous-C2TDCM]